MVSATRSTSERSCAPRGRTSRPSLPRQRDPRYDKVSRTALGTLGTTWTEFDSGVPAVEAARADGYQVIAIELTSDAFPSMIPMETDVALVIGHEDRGCLATLAACDGVAFIPQLGKVGSLNVAHAASIAIYEARRRSWSR